MKVYKKGQLRLREDNVTINLPKPDDFSKAAMSFNTGNSGNSNTDVTLTSSGNTNGEMITLPGNKTPNEVSGIVAHNPSANFKATFDPNNGKTKETKNESKQYRHSGNLIEGAVVFTKSELRDFLNNL